MTHALIAHGDPSFPPNFWYFVMALIIIGLVFKIFF